MVDGECAMRRRFVPLVSAGVACALLTSTFVTAQVVKKNAKVAAPRKAEAADPPRDAPKPAPKDRPAPPKANIKKAAPPAEEADERPPAPEVKATLKVAAPAENQDDPPPPPAAEAAPAAVEDVQILPAPAVVEVVPTPA